MYFGSINKLFYLEKTTVLWKISFIAGVANVIMNFIFIPIFGYKVAAVTTFISLMFMGYSGYFLKDFKENCNINYYPFYWIAGTIILTILSYLIRDIALVSKMVISLAAFCLLVFLTWHFLVKKKSIRN